MSVETVTIDRDDSAARIENDIETLAGSDYTQSNSAIQRYAYTQVYRNTLDYFTTALQELNFDVYEDPVGTLVGRNRPPGTKVFGIGSHCDSNRNGGKYDGTLGVAAAVELLNGLEQLRSRDAVEVVLLRQGVAASAGVLQLHRVVLAPHANRR